MGRIQMTLNYDYRINKIKRTPYAIKSCHALEVKANLIITL